jgi:hypothetical protein
MAQQNHNPADVSPEALQTSQKIWSGFTKATQIGIIATAVLLIAMAVFLLD